MTTRYKTEGFVLNREDNLDVNRVFSVFTKDFGKIEVLGRAIRKIDSKLKGGIELFSLSYIEFVQGKNRKTLTDAVFINSFKKIFENNKALEIANEIAKLTNSFIKGQETDEAIFNLLNEVFAKLSNSYAPADKYQLIYHYFFWNFVSALGYQPELSRCANCQKKLNPYELYFSNRDGGVICRGCNSLGRSGFKIKSDIVKVIRLILKKDWEMLLRLKFGEAIQKSLLETLDNYYLYLFGNLRTLS